MGAVLDILLRSVVVLAGVGGGVQPPSRRWRISRVQDSGRACEDSDADAPDLRLKQPKLLLLHRMLGRTQGDHLIPSVEPW